MKVAVYNRYWRTLGGGEKYSGFVAHCLADDHDVDLLTHEPLDRLLLKERLDLDLSGVGVRIIPEGDDVAFGYETSRYDLLINATYGSDAMCRSTHGLYICYFPIPHPPIRTGVAALAERLLPGKRSPSHAHMEWGDGWFGHERAKHVYRWSTEQPNLRIWTPKGAETAIQLVFLRLMPRQAGPTELDISIDGRVVRTVTIAPGHGELRVTLPLRGGGPHPALIQFNCSTFSPGEILGSDDPRRLGVALVADQSGRPANGLTYSRRSYTSTPQMHFLDSYDEIAAISQYTKDWVTRLWEKPSQILTPPVTLQTRADKEPIILSVGRFFDHAGGHCKKQAEMVTAFRALVDRGLQGWTYHLAGGCEREHAAYLERVGTLAEGLPVQIHPNASGATLKDLYSRASIFWHATGLEEDEKLFPERAEHFGITTIEAMSAGAVPIVIGKGGQLETLVDRVHGRHFTKLSELIEITWEVIHDEGVLRRYSLAAEERGQTFGPDAFRKTLNAMVEGISSR
ncbi:MAG TPA: glycosyltransferase [Actinomycetota bacterium]|nr:glycosyltransferase [Actinomycetota bacterium]